MDLDQTYMQQAVNPMPAAWNVTLLDLVAKRGSGHTPNKLHSEYWNGQIKWISLQDSNRLDRLYIEDTGARITPAGLANSSAVLHPAGTVVLSRDAGVGKSAIMRDTMCVSQHFMAWTCGPSLSNRYLYYWLQSQKSEFERIAMGNTIKTIGLPYFRALTLPVPPMAEQEAIAEALSDADAYIESLEQLLAKKRDIKQGVMQELLTGKRRLPSFDTNSSLITVDEVRVPADWTVVEAGSIGRFRGGSGFPISYQGSSEGEIPFFKVSDMNRVGNETLLETANNYISADSRRRLGAPSFPKHTIVFAKVGAAIFLERKRILARESSLDNNMAGFTLFDVTIDHRFVYNALLMIRLASLAATTALPSLNNSVLNTIKLAFPSNRLEQEAITGVLSDLDSELIYLEMKRDKAIAIRQGMMQNLLTGKIRLV